MSTDLCHQRGQAVCSIVHAKWSQFQFCSPAGFLWQYLHLGLLDIKPRVSEQVLQIYHRVWSSPWPCIIIMAMHLSTCSDTIVNPSVGLYALMAHTRYFPSGENLQSWLVCLNNSEKFMILDEMHSKHTKCQNHCFCWLRKCLHFEKSGLRMRSTILKKMPAKSVSSYTKRHNFFPGWHQFERGFESTGQRNWLCVD